MRSTPSALRLVTTTTASWTGTPLRAPKTPASTFEDRTVKLAGNRALRNGDLETAAVLGVIHRSGKAISQGLPGRDLAPK